MIAGLRTYPAYKDSDLPWLEQVPAHWELLPNRSLIRRRKVLVGTGHADYALLSLTKQGVIVRDVESGKGKFSADEGTCQEVRKGDLVFCLFDVPETPRTVGLSSHDGMITGAYTVFESSDIGLMRYLELFYLAMDDRKLLSPLYSALRNTIPPTRLLGTKTPIPPSGERELIIRFLSYVDRRIRHYIRVKQKLIKLLEEQKRALTSSAVLHGIDANSETVPSRKAWSDNAPAHWSRLRLKDVAWIQTGLTLGKNYSGKELRSYLYLRVANVQAGRLDLRVVKVVEVPPEEAERCCLEEGDVLMTEGGDIDKLGRGCIWRSEIDNCLHQNHIFAVRCRPELDPNYLVALMGSTHGRAYFETTAKQTTNLASTNSTTLRAFPIALPPIDEQLRILGHLKRELAPTDAAFEQARREIDLLREYHLRLIADVVTGKLDVREAAANLPEEIIQEEMAQDELEPFAEDGLEDDDPSLDAELEEVDA